MTVATSVNVSNVEHRNRSFNVVDDLKDFFAEYGFPVEEYDGGEGGDYYYNYRNRGYDCEDDCDYDNDYDKDDDDDNNHGEIMMMATMIMTCAIGMPTPRPTKCWVEDM